MEQTTSRVLIVDDMPINRMIISSLLASNGVLSDQAEGGSECLALCESHDYDLILLDHRMPEPDGIDTLLALKELFIKKGRTVPVICHTTEDGKDNIKLYKAAGFADVLIKPIDPRLLSEIVMTYLPEKDKVIEQEDALIESLPEVKEEDSSDPDTRDEIEKLPIWLKTVPHLDLVAGINNLGTAEEYLYSLYVFLNSAEEKSDEIKTAYDNGDQAMFKLCVHSLKSMSRLVGARQLSVQAADLEKASEKSSLDELRRETSKLLSSYGKYAEHLAPLKTDKTVQKLMDEEIENTEAPDAAAYESDHGKKILFIHSTPGIVTKGIEQNLQSAGFKVTAIADEPSLLIANRQEADIVLYYPCAPEASHISLTMNLLGEICLDDAKIFCLTGDAPDLELALSSSGAGRVSRTYQRPVNIQRFIKDMEYFSDLLFDYHRKKTIYIADDDHNYLSVIDHWLSSAYQVSCFHGGDELLSGLSASKPDLILLDYEMPGKDGYELLKLLRKDDRTRKIPVIFLTGKNDRDHVFKILEYKPDGYLLKTTQREALLDTIHRFFSETMFKKSQSLDNPYP